MKTRRLHKITGIILLLPFIAWTATAVFFLVRPAYESAYETLSVRQYPLAAPYTLPADKNWQEIHFFNTALGGHLVVKEQGRWRNLDPATLRERPYPAADKVRVLLEDAMTDNPERYGDIAVMDGRRITTTTGVDITLNWDTMSFSQQGRDTRWINRIYSIHYLEWTGFGPLDKFLGLLGLFLLMYMTYTGAVMAFGRDRKPKLPGTEGG